jgi:hypothetical protein
VSTKAFVAVITIAMASWIVALTGLFYSFHRAQVERRALIDFMCVGLQVREETSQANAEEFRVAYEAILGRLGEKCRSTTP